jgi:hypothetical protein
MKAVSFDFSAGNRLEWVADADYSLEAVFTSGGGGAWLLTQDAECTLSTVGASDVVRFDILGSGLAAAGFQLNLSCPLLKGTSVFCEMGGYGLLVLYLLPAVDVGPLG